jgi:hypothetical protein
LRFFAAPFRLFGRREKEMNLRAMAATAAMTATALYAGDGKRDGAYELTVYISGEKIVPLAIRARGEWMAARMLAQAGVRITWSHCRPPEGQAWREHGMSLEFRLDGGPQGPAIAFVRPYEGSTITILYDRMGWAEASPVFAPRLLAHTLVHEITHGLQAVARHSATGVMKARWTLADYNEMSIRFLPFETIDLELIREGLKRRAASISTAGGYTARRERFSSPAEPYPPKP